MRLDRYQKTMDKLTDENRHLRLLTVGLLVLLVIAFFVLGGKEVVVVQTPNNLTQAIKVQRNAGDQAYMERWALSFAELIGNITPANVDFVVQAIESYFDAAVYQKIKVALEEQAALLKAEQATVTFAPKNIVYEKKTGYVYVSGMQEVRSFSVDPRRKQWTMEFGIRVVNYLPVVTHFDAYEGAPKTQDVRELEKQSAQAGGA